MRVRVPAERGRLFPSDPTGSRWWYWVAAVPLCFGFWMLAVGWVTVAVSLNPMVGTGPEGALPFALSVSLVVLGAPLGVVLLAFPFALSRDAHAVETTDVGWRPDRTRYVVAAVVGPAVGLATVALVVTGVLAPATGLAALAGFTLAYLVATPVALHYLRGRRRAVGVP